MMKSIRLVVLRSGCEMSWDNAMDKTLTSRSGKLELDTDARLIVASHPKFINKYSAESVLIPLEQVNFFVLGEPQSADPKPVPPSAPVVEAAPANPNKDTGTVKFVKNDKGQTCVKLPDGTLQVVTAKLT